MSYPFSVTSFVKTTTTSNSIDNLSRWTMAKKDKNSPPRKAFVPSYMNCMKMLHSDMSNLLRDGEYSDLKISCNGRVFKVHRAILFPRCKFFAACGQFKEGEEGIIALDDDDPYTLGMVLGEIYTRNTHIIKNHFAEDEFANFICLIEVWKLADKYQLPGLTRQCLTYISSPEGLDTLKERSQQSWTSELLTGLIASDELGKDDKGTNWNKEMREMIKQLVLSSKKFSQLSVAEQQLLTSDNETCVELLMQMSKEHEMQQDWAKPAVVQATPVQTSIASPRSDNGWGDSYAGGW